MTTRKALLLIAVVVAVLAGTPSLHHPHEAQAVASTFTVTKIADTNDGNCDADCSLREAIAAANSNGNAAEQDMIEFAIPGAGPHIIGIVSALPVVSQAVHIRGESQPGASCVFPGRTILIEIREDGVGTFTGLVLNHGGALGSIVSGVAITNFGWHGVAVAGSIGHTVRCSHLGLNAAGSASIPNGLSGVLVQIAPGSIIGGPATSDRNVIAGNSHRSISVVTGSGNLTIENNYIGFSADGMTRIHNGLTDIFISGSSGVSLLSNRFAGPAGVAAIAISGPGTGHLIRNNSFGLDATDNPLSVLPFGAVEIYADEGEVSTGHQIGGVEAGQANRMVLGGTNAVSLYTFSSGVISGVTIRGNEIDLGSSVGQLGIDLVPDGSAAGDIHANDSSDADDGPNGLQNFPILSGASSSTSTVLGEFFSQPFQPYTLDFYASETCDGAFREGERYIGSLSVLTDANGNASVSAGGLDAFTANQGITATATDANGSTSEFSACVFGGPKTVVSVTPSEAVAGSAEEIVTVSGTAFVESDIIRWSGDSRPTTWVDASTLTFTVTAGMKDSFNTHHIEVIGAQGQIAFFVTRSSSDVGCDGVADASDASLLLRSLAGLQPLNEDCPDDPDLSGGDPDIADVLHIRMEIAGLIQPLKSPFQ